MVSGLFWGRFRLWSGSRFCSSAGLWCGSVFLFAVVAVLRVNSGGIPGLSGCSEMGKRNSAKHLGESVRQRDTFTGRQIRKDMGAANVAAAVGPISRGCEIFGLTKGNWSLVDLIEHCLRATGPADVVLSTWTAGGADITFANRLLVNGSIRSFRLVVDFSFPRTCPAYCAAARQAFGDGAIRLTKNHSRFFTIRNDGFNLAVRTSMNLSENRRVEWFEISDCAPMAEFLVDAVDCLFTEQTEVETFAIKPGEHVRKFADAFERFGGKSAPAIEDQQQFFGNGALDIDLRRVGVTYD